MYEKCAFTGHRILEKDFDYKLLDRVIYNLIQGGTKTFLCGMAAGFDMACAESVINHKKNFDVQIIACIPCVGQEKFYSETNKRRYREILENCTEKIVYAEKYYYGCMLLRDRAMVDNCDVLVTYQRRNRGGTAYTVNYAKEKGVNLIEL